MVVLFLVAEEVFLTQIGQGSLPALTAADLVTRCALFMPEQLGFVW